jgi:hypothetical protein
VNERNSHIATDTMAGIASNFKHVVVIVVAVRSSKRSPSNKQRLRAIVGNRRVNKLAVCSDATVTTIANSESRDTVVARIHVERQNTALSRRRENEGSDTVRDSESTGNNESAAKRGAWSVSAQGQIRTTTVVGSAFVNINTA